MDNQSVVANTNLVLLITNLIYDNKLIELSLKMVLEFIFVKEIIILNPKHQPILFITRFLIYIGVGLNL